MLDSKQSGSGAGKSDVPADPDSSRASSARGGGVSSEGRDNGQFHRASDEALLRAMSEGHDKAFDVLFNRHSGAVLSFLSRLVASRVDPEDLLQETFLRVLTHASDFRAGADFRPWLFTIARNIAYNALKRSKSRVGLEVQTDLSDWQPPSRSSLAAEPSSNMERQERHRALLSALEELPPMHREIIVLTVFNGFTYEQAAAITGDPEGTLRSRVFHGLRKLRERLKERV
jgi:RNA polymerase sigma-70 factor (ECF subfamily)